jgi:hypothetical protein
MYVRWYLCSKNRQEIKTVFVLCTPKGQLLITWAFIQKAEAHIAYDSFLKWRKRETFKPQKLCRCRCAHSSKELFGKKNIVQPFLAVQPLFTFALTKTWKRQPVTNCIGCIFSEMDSEINFVVFMMLTNKKVEIFFLVENPWHCYAVLAYPKRTYIFLGFTFTKYYNNTI